MRINQANRILCNEADASPGGGAAPTPAPAPASTAPVTPPVVTVDVLDAKLEAFQNGLFANFRKAGLLGKEKPAEPTPTPTPTPAPQPATAAAPAPTGLSMADVQALLDRDRVVTRVQIENKLTDAQVKRMRSALDAEKPDDVSTWTTTYLADMGLVKQNPTPNPITPTPAPQPSGAPISDKGSPAPGTGSNWNREFADNPLNMSAAAIAAMNAELGIEVARKKRVEAGLAKGASIKVTPR